MPPGRAADDFRVRIEHELVRIEAVARVRRIGPVHAVAIELPGVHVRQIPVPDHVRLLLQRNRQRFDLGVDRIEQAELDSRRMLGEHREVHADTVPGRAKRRRRARPDAQIILSHRRATISNSQLRNSRLPDVLPTPNFQFPSWLRWELAVGRWEYVWELRSWKLGVEPMEPALLSSDRSMKEAECRTTKRSPCSTI